MLRWWQAQRAFGRIITCGRALVTSNIHHKRDFLLEPLVELLIYPQRARARSRTLRYVRTADNGWVDAPHPSTPRPARAD